MSADTPGRRIVIVGGSLAGLVAGNLLHRLGWDVRIFERTPGVMEGRGAGITILPGLVESFRAAGVDETAESLGIVLPARMALDRAGNVVAERPFRQAMTSWRRLYDALRAVFPTDRYHAGTPLERIDQSADMVTATFLGGERVDAELLVGADGLRSTVREQLAPAVIPHYPGYIAWRCLTDERALSPGTHAALFDRYTVCVAPGQQGIGYPVPGPDHSTLPGGRQYNVVWYQPVPEAGLPRLLSDDSGRYHANGIPPALLSTSVRTEMVATAKAVLAPQFAEAIERARLRFFQPIVDLELPRLVYGRVVIIGDAAFVARPHVAAGVPKAAGDALALANALARGGDDCLSALPQFEAERLRIGRSMVARGRYLGSYMAAQLRSEQERQTAESSRVPEQVMMETAAPFDYEAATASAGSGA